MLLLEKRSFARAHAAILARALMEVLKAAQSSIQMHLSLVLL